jgi:hypothetical protein
VRARLAEQRAERDGQGEALRQSRAQVDGLQVGFEREGYRGSRGYEDEGRDEGMTYAHVEGLVEVG